MKTKVGEKMENQEFGVSMGNGRIQLSELGKSVLTQVVCFLLAGLSASASSYEYFSPLGIAFCSGIDRKNTLSSEISKEYIIIRDDNLVTLRKNDGKAIYKIEYAPYKKRLLPVKIVNQEFNYSITLKYL